MRKLFSLSILPIMFFSLQGCQQIDTGVPLSQKQISTIIEDFDAYTLLNPEEKERLPFPPAGCLVYKDYLSRVEAGEVESNPIYEETMKNFDWSKYAELGQKIQNGEIKKREVYLGSGGASLVLYLTPRYDVTQADEKEMKRCTEGEGYLSLFKLMGDNIIWGDIECSSGVAFTEEEFSGITESTQECLKVREELMNYKDAL